MTKSTKEKLKDYHETKRLTGLFAEIFTIELLELTNDLQGIVAGRNVYSKMLRKHSIPTYTLYKDDQSLAQTTKWLLKCYSEFTSIEVCFILVGEYSDGLWAKVKLQGDWLLPLWNISRELVIFSEDYVVAFFDEEHQYEAHIVKLDSVVSSEEADKGRRKDFNAFLASVPDVETDEEDRLD